MKTSNRIQLSAGGGGRESAELVKNIRRYFNHAGKWQDRDADSAVLRHGGKSLVYTTDSYTVSPLFFPGGDIGKLAICGTINDLAVMGAQPLGISLGLIIEEGFSKKDLNRILKSIGAVSQREKVPVVTGDTKIMDKGKVDGLVINTSGIGEAGKVIKNEGLRPDHNIICSGSIGDHGAALLARRFGYNTKLESDCQPIWSEIKNIKPFLKACKDPTRGGLATVIHEMANKAKVKVILEEELVPIKKQTRAICDMLGISPYDLACEGRFIAGVSAQDAKKVLAKNRNMKIIGTVVKGGGVMIKTKIGTRSLPLPEGKLVPRIC